MNKYASCYECQIKRQAGCINKSNDITKSCEQLKCELKESKHNE